MHRFMLAGAIRRTAVVACLTALLAGCGGTEDQAAMDSGMAIGGDTMPMAGSASTSLADRAGTWEGHSMPMDADSVIATWTLVSTANTDGWTITFPTRDPVPVRVVATEGDSVTIEFGPYESTTRPGEMQTVRGASRMEGGQLVGTYEARIASMPDSVFRGRSVATRTP